MHRKRKAKLIRHDDTWEYFYGDHAWWERLDLIILVLLIMVLVNVAAAMGGEAGNRYVAPITHVCTGIVIGLTIAARIDKYEPDDCVNYDCPVRHVTGKYAALKYLAAINKEYLAAINKELKAAGSHTPESMPSEPQPCTNTVGCDQVDHTTTNIYGDYHDNRTCPCNTCRASADVRRSQARDHLA